MSLTFYQALAQECSAETVRAAHALSEARRNSGVSYAGLGGATFTPRTDAELHAAARLRMQARADLEVTPKGRFVLCVAAVQAKAKADGNLALYSACSRALECAGRGIEGEIDHASNCLAAIEALGGDVAEARAALADAGAAQLLAAE